MKFTPLVVCLLVAFAASTLTPAQAQTAAPQSQALPAAPATPSSSPTSDAEVRKVDMDTKKITLKHGEIKSLDMPPMTMIFQVSDEKMLSAVKPGDKVKFNAEKIKGAFTVTAIEIQKP